MGKTKIVLSTVFFTVFFPVNLYCQSEFTDSPLPDCTISKTKTQASRSKIISIGVINGRALRLVKPEYPSSARMVNARGKVTVNVLIDESGCVGEARVISGHSLLTNASLRAAKASIFEPVTVSGNRVRVYGIITYNYLPNSMNWLELGFNSDSYETLSEFLPAGFDTEAKLFRDSKDLTWAEKQRALETIKEDIENDLLSVPKSHWLFSIGIWIRSSMYGVWSDSSREKSLSELRELLVAAPAEVSPRLTARLRDLLDSENSEDFNKSLHEIEVRLFDLGT